jgi:methionyl aminopeptidase
MILHMDPLIEGYRKLAPIMGAILAELENELRPGRTTRELEQIAEDAIHRAGVKSCFLGYRGYPACITASVNEEVLNTPPSKRVLTDGDLLKLQVGIKDGIGFSYQAWTYFLGNPSKADAQFVETGRIALSRALAAVRAGPGSVINSIAGAIQSTMEGAGYSINKKFVGHGMGMAQHEEPQIPGYVPSPEDIYKKPVREGKILSVLVIAHQGTDDCRVLSDNWNVVTRDRSKALLLSQIVVVRDGPAEVLLPPRNSRPFAAL